MVKAGGQTLGVVIITDIGRAMLGWRGDKSRFTVRLGWHARHADGGPMAVSPQQQHRALRLLADAPLGVTEAMMLAHGFKDEMLARLLRDGLATASPGSIHAGGRPMKVTWLRITEAGRQALAG